MKTVNLLPAWYLKQGRRQRNLRVHAVAMVLIGAAMVTAIFVGRQRLALLNQQRDQLAARMTQVGDPEVELRAKKMELRNLKDLSLARQELGPTIPMSAVVQQLQNAMTPGMALSNVTLDVRRDPIKGSGVVGDTHAPPRYHDVAHICVLGIAPEERHITRLVQSVSRNPLFDDVTLDYIRTGTLQGYSVRRFEIQLSMDMEKLSLLPPKPAVEAVASTVQLPLALVGAADGQ